MTNNTQAPALRWEENDIKKLSALAENLKTAQQTLNYAAEFNAEFSIQTLDEFESETFIMDVIDELKAIGDDQNNALEHDANMLTETIVEALNGFRNGLGDTIIIDRKHLKNDVNGHDHTGHTVTFSGAGHTLTVSIAMKESNDGCGWNYEKSERCEHFNGVTFDGAPIPTELSELFDDFAEQFGELVGSGSFGLYSPVSEKSQEEARNTLAGNTALLTLLRDADLA